MNQTSHISGTWMTIDSLATARPVTLEALWTGSEIGHASIHLVGSLLNSTSDRYVLCASELVDKLGVGEVVVVVDLEVLVHLGALTLDGVLMLSVWELLSHLGAGIWDVADEHDLIVVHTILLESEVVHEPSALVGGDGSSEGLKVGFFVTGWSTLSFKYAITVLSVGDSEDDPLN